MENQLECPVCLEATGMGILSVSHPEFQMASFTNDGTKKWFFCPKCQGVFCRDKITARWQYSPKTYDLLVSRGQIEDKLDRGR